MEDHPASAEETKLQEELDDARMKALGWVPDGEKVRGGLSNVETKWTSAQGKDIPVLWYRQIDTLSEDLSRLSGGWPKSINGLLFVLSGRRAAPRYLTKTPDLFSWMARVMDVHWKSKGDVRSAITGVATPITKEEFHAHLKETVADRYLAVSTLPHEPPIPGVYYLPCELPPPTGKALEAFLAALNPETEDDRQLLLALLLTPLWGGPCGTRPAFLLSSGHGRGSGKTSTANAIADVFGGAFRVQAKEDWEQIGKRLLGDRALNLRVLIRDNVKGKVAAEELESFITDPEISGWRPFHGDFSRPNYMTCILTANAPRLGADMADRAVEVRIGDRRHGVPFVSWCLKFMETDGLQLLSDLRARLQEPPRGEIPSDLVDRWAEWQRAVLSRCDNPGRLAELIQDRRADTDTDSEEAEEVADAITAYVDEKAIPTGRDGLVRISRDQMREILIRVGLMDQKESKRYAHAIVSNMLGSHGPLSGLTDSRRKDRCWLWKPILDIPI